MRVLLDENLPVDLAAELTGHVDTVIGVGWSGLTNGELLGRATGTIAAGRTFSHEEVVEWMRALMRQTSE